MSIIHHDHLLKLLQAIVEIEHSIKQRIVQGNMKLTGASLHKEQKWQKQAMMPNPCKFPAS